ncbi:MAG TPA: VWA domain-containing protein [Vicinamibacteria bacterium]|nr:VWA domain-containing protein [Vicinamibacteria bacterium]
MISSLVASGSLLALLGLAPAEPPPDPSAPAPPPFVVRISVDLVQVDAVVTDKKGRLVTDLRPEDFEIVEDGRKQPLTNVSYISLAPLRGGGVDPAPLGSTIPRPEGAAVARRTVAVVVDDMQHSFISTVQLREAIRHFVTDRLEPGDEASIVFTSSGLAGATPYTSDKPRLLAMVDQIIWGRGWLGHELSPNDPTVRATNPLMLNRHYSFWGGVRPPGASMADAFHADRLGRLGYERQARAFVSGTFGVVNDVVRDLRVRPGRKSLVLFSEGVPFYTTADYTSDEYANVVNAMGRLVDQANRASVVLYTIDARGIQTGGLTAQDSLRQDETPSKLAELRSARQYEATVTQDPLRYLASETGGLFLGANDMRDSLGRVLADQAGFYLLGYVPSEDTFKPGDDGPRFHTVKVKVKRSGVRVRSRKSFYGVADVEPAPAPTVVPRGSAAVAVLP